VWLTTEVAEGAEFRNLIAPRHQANKNPKLEYRNPKQTRRQINLKLGKSKTPNPNQECFEFCVFQSFEFVSNFEFRASKFILGSPFDLAQDMLCDFARDILTFFAALPVFSAAITVSQ
jgi:hypothetical protein